MKALRIEKLFIILSIVCIGFALGCFKKDTSLEAASKAYKLGNYKAAAEIYFPEANKGNPDALVNLAFMHYCGLHVKKDHKQAYEYYLEAANKNNVTAQFSIATMYENGEGIAQNLGEAYFWYLIAEGQNDLDSRRLRREAELKLSANIIKEVRRRVEEWQPIN